MFWAGPFVHRPHGFLDATPVAVDQDRKDHRLPVGPLGETRECHDTLCPQQPGFRSDPFLGNARPLFQGAIAGADGKCRDVFRAETKRTRPPLDRTHQHSRAETTPRGQPGSVDESCTRAENIEGVEPTPHFGHPQRPTPRLSGCPGPHRFDQTLGHRIVAVFQKEANEFGQGPARMAQQFHRLIGRASTNPARHFDSQGLELKLEDCPRV